MITLGRHSYLGSYHDNYNGVITIGNFTSIANGVTFLGVCEHPPRENPLVVSTYNFAERWAVEGYPQCSGRPITIGHDVWIGENVLILDGVTIGNGAIIGAGSVVSKSVPPFEVWAGNPIIKIKERFAWWNNTNRIAKLEQIAWWNWSDDEIKARLPDFINVENFVEKYGP